MWIQNKNEATVRLYNPEYMDEPVEFNSNGTAKVAADIGKRLVNDYPSIVPYTKDDEEDSESSEETEEAESGETDAEDSDDE